ncbi:MAG: entericidin A/B family lipoprotein [Dissulfurimicrobium sp.]|nr:entericidin A/B family lipoprotein [Dissulfurimicrobium hydrothermale]UKL14220.1 entericidin A/B family lipoprotein [Dissulfurimicrobium hydrothermale]
MFKKIIFVLFLASFCLTAAGCNTIHGLGKDIEKGGEAIQKSTR